MTPKEARSALIKTAADLLLRNYIPSDNPDDYTQKTYSGNVVARMMEPGHEELRKMATRISEIARALK